MGAPLSICSSVRRSAMQAEPRQRSWLDTVPEPMIVPAAERARLGGMGDQLRKGERHVLAGIGCAEVRAVELDQQRQMQLAVLPGVAQFVGRHRHGRKGASGLGLEEAETLGQFGRDQVAQATRRSPASAGGCASRGLCASQPIGTSPVITATSPSKSMPQASSRGSDGIARAR